LHLERTARIPRHALNGAILTSAASARPQMNIWIMGPSVSFQFSPAGAGFARSRKSRDCAEAYVGYVAQATRSRKSRDCAEAYVGYVAQAISQIDAEIAEKGHFWMETS
jgi:hypothetical protein